MPMSMSDVYRRFLNSELALEKAAELLRIALAANAVFGGPGREGSHLCV